MDTKANEIKEEQVEVKFPKELFEDVTANPFLDDDGFKNFGSLLVELNKQVSTADGSVNELVKQKENLDQQAAYIDEQKSILENDRFNFEKQMKDEYQKLNDLKIDFEQEKTKMFNSIQQSREEFEKNKRDFEKYRKEQISLIENSKNTLTKNYEQFEKIVSTFNSKLESYNDNNE